MNYKYDAVETGKRIRAIRKQNKFTQEQLAEELYLTAESVSNFENGKTTRNRQSIAVCSSVLSTKKKAKKSSIF